MREMMIIARKDIGEALRSRSTWIAIGVSAAISLTYVQANQNINMLLLVLPFILTMLSGSFFSVYAVVTDKSRRTLESLLATPVSMRQAWVGKALGVAVPAILISLVITIIVVIATEYNTVVPETGRFIIPDTQSLIVGLVIVPIVSFMIVCIVTAVQLLMSNPRLANLIFSGFFVIFFITNISVITNQWNFGLIYLGMFAGLAVILVVLDRFLTKEKVVLSSKG